MKTAECHCEEHQRRSNLALKNEIASLPFRQRRTRLRRAVARNDNFRGFTLVEVLMAVTVLTVGVIFISQAFTRSLDAVKRMDENAAVSSFLERAAADLMIKTWDGSDEGSVLQSDQVLRPDGPYQFALERQDISLGQNMFDYFILQMKREGQVVGQTAFLAHKFLAQKE